MDLFFAMRPSASGGSLLYVSDGPMHYRDETAARGLSDVGDAMGCLAFDAEGDGDDDLLVTGNGGVRLFLAEGGTFVDRTSLMEVSPNPAGAYVSAAAADLDGDNDLDILVSGYLACYGPESLREERCGIDSDGYAYVSNLFLERTADGRYRDVASSRSADWSHYEPTLTVIAADINNDNRVDILEGNDFGWTYRNRALIQQVDGTFVDEGPGRGLDRDHRNYGMDAMGIAVGDLDHNGFMDFVVSGFEAESTVVFACDGTGHCNDRSLESGTLPLAGTFRWGNALADFDLDGWLDLAEATGHLLTNDEIREQGYEGPRDQQPNFLAGNGDGSLRPVAPTSSDGRVVSRSLRGIALTDLDEDGQPDIVFAPAIGSPLLLRTVRPSVGHFLRVTLRGRTPNTDGVGAMVTVRAGASVYVRPRLAGEGYLGNFDKRLFFGITEEGPVSLEVRWPSGARTTIDGIALDEDVSIREE